MSAVLGRCLSSIMVGWAEGVTETSFSPLAVQLLASKVGWASPATEMPQSVLLLSLRFNSACGKGCGKLSVGA